MCLDREVAVRLSEKMQIGRLLEEDEELMGTDYMRVRSAKNPKKYERKISLNSVLQGFFHGFLPKVERVRREVKLFIYISLTLLGR